MATYLDKIISDHREMAASDTRSTTELLRHVSSMQPCVGFREALLGGGVSVIAEIKRKSPSKGALNLNLDPVVQAKAYSDSGASCISVLTDSQYFLGSLDDLLQVRNAVDIPLLRKDFTVSRNDVLDARIYGADAVLLIVAALQERELLDLFSLAKDVGLDVLVEVHDREELDRALEIGADMIGVNQRDLFTFQVDVSRARNLIGYIPESVVKICESGIDSEVQMNELLELGYEAALIGETLVKSNDPSARLASLVSAGKSEI